MSLWVVMLATVAAFATMIVAAFVTPPPPSDVVLDKAMEGLWRGLPEYSILGPWSNNLTFAISRADNGDYLLSNNFDGPDNSMGWQRFYLQSSGASAGQLGCMGPRHERSSPRCRHLH
jgi:hypothetical protein